MYYVRGEGGCVTPGSCGSVTVTVTVLDDSSFNYASTTFCVNDTDPTPSITGLTGGIFSASPAGLSINTSTGVIDVSASTSSTYTITYTTSGTCPNSSNVSVMINSLANSLCTDPTVTTLSPLDEATNVAINTNLVITFSENIVKGTGNVVIFDSDNIPVETIAINTAAVSISGVTVTINPTSDLMGSTYYYIQIDATAFKDVSNNNYAGIADSTTWNFTTEVTVSLEGNLVSQRLIIYPNPVNNTLTIQVENQIEINEVIIYNILGKIVKTVKDRTLIDVSNFSDGVYLIKIMTDKGIGLKRFIKN
jgi:methionine-rich copper-binding protein CopC